ncbi:MAG: AAA family ATPase [Caldimicrobium sp.]|nr:AAA family ATPase [Caldimicrobium sp.]MDW8182730.1 AAA family ATPase [Caldimicrobium sp.]
MGAMIHWDKVLTRESLPFKTEEFYVVQTHISYVVITDKVVYKIKKPVNFGFLDFTTLDKRRYYCEQEVILNRRLCGDLYLGVVGITKSDDLYFVEGEGEVVEYAVKMRKLPTGGMMKDLLTRGEISHAHLDLIVQSLVPFYKEAETGERVNYYGTIEIITYNCEENFSQTRDFIGKALTERKYKHIVNFTRDFLANQKDLFNSRIEKGFIRDGHGDLYSANICFDNLKRVYIFDCIEFNERFRCGDVASDLAFLAMDLDFHRFRELSRYFIHKYMEESNDQDLLKVLDFYKCYRAYVRGKIGCFTYADEGVPIEERRRALETAQRYFDLAFHYAGGKPKVAVFMGLSGTGKTTLARNFLEFAPAVYISSDITRKKLLGLEPEVHYYAEFEKGIYTPEITEKTYRKMIEYALEEISYGRDVILDATFKEGRYREVLKEVLREAGVTPLWILCKAPEEVIKDRIFRRTKEKTVSDALFETYLSQKRTFENPTEENLLEVDTSLPMQDILVKVRGFLQF